MPPDDPSREPDPADRTPIPAPWEVNELVYHDDPERQVAELAEQLEAERVDVYGDLAEDVRFELENRAAPDSPYDLSEITYDNGLAILPAEWDLDKLFQQVGDVPLVPVELPPEERAQIFAELASNMTSEDFAEYAARSMGGPEQPERVEPEYADPDYDDPERYPIDREPFESFEDQQRRLDLEAQNYRTQERYDAEDEAERMAEEAAERVLENPDIAAAPPSIAAELRAARVYLENRTRHAEHGAQPTAGPDAEQLAREEQQHRESARVMSEREQPQQERDIER